MLAARLSVLQGHSPLFSGCQAQFRQRFSLLLHDLELHEWGFKPYSLRRGGATHHFQLNGQLSSTVVKGRWGSAKSARVYINDGLATMASFRFDPNQSRKINKAIEHLEATCGFQPGMGAWK
jgi:hypothetical protein